MATNQNSGYDPNHMFPESDGLTNKPSNYTPRVAEPVTPDIIHESETIQNQFNQDAIPQQVNTAPPKPVAQNNISTPAQNNYYQNIQDQISQNPYFDIQEPANPVQNKSQLNTSSQKVKKPFLPFNALGDFLIKRWWLVLLVSILISLITVSLYTFVVNNNQPVSDYTNIESRIEGPKTLPSGTPGTWKVIVQNRESVQIQQIEIKLSFDRSFKYSKKINPDPADTGGTLYKLASLQPVGQGTSDTIITFEGLLTGNIDEQTVMTGEVSYVPSPLINKPNSRIFVPILPLKTAITSPEIQAQFVTSQSTVQSGNEAELTLKFQNLSEREISNLRVKIIYPDKSFVYSSSELILSASTAPRTKPDDGNNIWYISSLPRLQSQTLKVRGTINGAEGVKQTFLSEISVKNGDDYSVLQSTPADITITSQPLVISTSIDSKGQNPYFSPGEGLTFTISYQNKSNQTLNNIELFASIDDPSDLLDYSTLKYNNGLLNNRIIQWKSSGVKQLENLPPQGKGVITYNIQVKKDDQFIKSGLNQSAYTLKPIIEGKALNLPQIRSEGFAYKATGALNAEQTVKRINGVSLSSTQRLYEVTWTLKTKQNKVNNVILTSGTNLPPSAWDQSSVSPTSMSNKISYNQLNGSIVWNAGNIDGYAGIINPPVSVTFRLLVDITAGGDFDNTQVFKSVSGQGVDDVTSEKYDVKLNEYTISE